jgi:hypothetical protein
MKKAFIVAAVLAVVGVLARRFGPKMPAIDWEKRLEAMPDNAPPNRNRPGTLRRHRMTDPGAWNEPA